MERRDRLERPERPCGLVVQHRGHRDRELCHTPPVGEVTEVEHSMRVQSRVFTAPTHDVVVGEIAVDRLHGKRFGMTDTDGMFEGAEHYAGTGLAHAYASEDLAEVRSLVVAPEAQGTGLGRGLVEACVEEAGQLGIRRVFALTAKPVFFERLGFERVARSAFPQKIWKDCFSCRFFESCPEVAVQRMAKDNDGETAEYFQESNATRTE